jgi:hypothetical protein
MGSEDAEGVGLAQDDAGHGPVGLGERLEGRQVGRAVGERGQLLELAVAGGEIGLGRLHSMSMDGAADEDAVAPGGAQRHERRLGRGGGPVVVRGRDDGQAGQLGQQRLELEDGLQGPLADLGLVRRVGRVELAARRDGLDGGRDVMSVDAGPKERDRVDPVARRERRTRASGSERGRQVGPLAGRREGCRRRAARPDRRQRGEHPAAVRRRLRTVDHSSAADPLSAAAASISSATSPGRQPETDHPTSAVRLAVDELGLRAQVGVQRYDLAGGGCIKVARRLDRFDDPEGLGSPEPPSDLGQLDEDDVAQLIGGIGRDAHDGLVAVDPEPP